MSIHTLIHDAALLKERLKYAQEAAAAGNTSEVAQKLNEAQQLFEQVVVDLTKPLFRPQYFAAGEPPRSAVYNQNLNGAWADLRLLRDELNQLNSLSTDIFNLMTIAGDDLLTDIEGISSTVVDLKFVNNMLRGDILVGGDDFANEDYRDTALEGAAPSAMISMGSLSLARADAEEVPIDRMSCSIVSVPQGRSHSLRKRRRSLLGRGHAYEGLFYAPMGEQRPAGGKFYVRELGPEDISGQSPAFDGKVIDFSTVTTFIFDDPPEEELEAARKQAYDGDPETFWEIEYVVRAYEQPKVLPRSGHKHTRFQKYPKAVGQNRHLVGNRGEFSVGLIFDFGREMPVNLFEVDPVMFDPHVPVRVEGIYYTTKTSERWRPVPNWDAYSTDKILTKVANRYLTRRQKELLEAFSQGSYQGKGIFPFPSVNATKLQVILGVRQGYPIVYERMYAILHDHVIVHKKKKTCRLGHCHTKHRTYHHDLYILVKLSYEQTLAMQLGLVSKEDLLQKPDVKGKSKSKDKELPDWLRNYMLGGPLGGPIGGVVGGAIGKLIGGVLGGLIKKLSGLIGKALGRLWSTKVKVWTEQTGWEIKKSWLQPQFDLARYAVGVKEARIGFYTYEVTSEYVSRPFGSPKPISKVMLVADDAIPDSYPIGRTYVKYFIQPDIPNYTKWHQINPQGKAPIFDENGDVVPKIINFNVKSPDADLFENKYISTPEPPKAIRVKIVINRPESDEPLIKGATPIVKSYRVLIYPQGGL